MCISNEKLAKLAEVIFSTVTADSAIQAAEQNAQFLTANHFYADLNSVSLETKIKIAEIEIIKQISTGSWQHINFM